jgi:hypothetical protein
MSIVPILSYQSMVTTPFCDYLNITTPKDYGDLVLRALSPYLDTLGCSEVSDGVFMLPEKGGTFKFSSKGRICIYSQSGGFLEALRRRGLFNQFLAEFAEFEHRISMLHATADFRVDSPEVIQQFKSLGQSGNFALTRKTISPKFVHALLSHDVDSRDTGTVYFGNRKNSDVWAKVYDKRHERLSKGLTDCGPLLRVEIAVHSGAGATLRDASRPELLFHHFASKSMVTPPPDIAQWVSYAEGYDLPSEVADLTGIQRMKSILEFSQDIARLLRIARVEYGQEGGSVLSGLLQKRFDMVMAQSI